MARFLMKQGIKASILTGAVYYTIDQGLWEGTEKADEVFGQIRNAASPYFADIPLGVPELPSTTNLLECSRHFYNRGVMASAEFVKDLPSTSLSVALSLKSSISGLLEASSAEDSSSNTTQKPA